MTISTPIKSVRKGLMHIQLADDTPLGDMLEILDQPGEILQNTRKRDVRRVGDFVIKASNFNRGTGVVKHTFRRDRYRTGWKASLALHERGISVPRPRAFIEYSFFPVILGNILISDYLHDCVDVQTWAAQHLKDSPDEADAFLHRLGAAIAHFRDSGAYHQDLKTDNILTPDGEHFYFIDLDDVVLDQTYPDPIRLKNHVQLYYGFSEILPRNVLDDFVKALAPASTSSDNWLADVIKGYDAWVERKSRIHAKLNK